MIKVVKRAIIRGSFSLFSCILCCTVGLVCIHRHAPIIDVVLLAFMAAGNFIFAFGNLAFAATTPKE